MTNIIDFTEPIKANPYDGDVAALIAAGEGKAAELIVPTDQANKARVLYAKAANAADRTARVRLQEEDKKAGTTRFVFTLKERRKPSRGKTGAEVEQTPDAPVE